MELVVPCHDEEKELPRAIERLMRLVDELPAEVQLTIVDSGSTDRTWEVARNLSEKFDCVRIVQVPLAGRGRALRQAWVDSAADLLAYTDVDLSGDPAELGVMVAMVASGAADIAIGSRLVPGARVERGLRREVLSRGYCQILQWVAAPPFLDAQCGLKVMTADCVGALLSDVADEEWFFDTELLMLAWQRGYRVVEHPIGWRERPETRVHLSKTALADLKGLWRISLGQRIEVGRKTVEGAPGSDVIRAELLAAATDLAGIALLHKVPRSSRRWAAVTGLVLAASGVAGAFMRPIPGRPVPAARAVPAVLAGFAVIGRGPGRRGRLLAVALLRAGLTSIRCVSIAAWRRRSHPSCATGQGPQV
jgi:hypothetical protein